MTLQQEFDLLRELKGNIESEAFQERIMKPIYKELEKQKNAYDCESLRELATVKGKKQGLMFLLKVIKGIHNDFNSKLEELNDIDISSN